MMNSKTGIVTLAKNRRYFSQTFYFHLLHDAATIPQFLALPRRWSNGMIESES